ncbi:flagellar biosynthesis protein FlhA [Jannaschia sp. Os4]|uniref:flagellar biosynthesis protein FlhA n=1 Tax=Jannaschia sp. Os4 TaxID=2807617 RepID=UPI0019398263|nr:flagellar biosynthesis protein FlhA [Jannaschia sp. Os4]MBM2575661.1 flagellar biosynthesis protein FlhA [Jannaschia sp. Os4]
MAAPTPAPKLLFLDGANRDVAFAIGVALVLAVLFVPLPPILLDVGLALSLSVSALILMVALWVPRPLEFNSFPTLLLVVTMLRLSLNVASTRLILSEGHTGTDAAGGVIEGFSRFIATGSFVIGVIVFAILVIINFVVISKGSTRIAEVSARFSLDAMPGKQMAIDADLGAGLIDEAEARARRKDLEAETGFYGAMDGASKFVRGDAVAGLIITGINIVGGIVIGTLQHGMALGDAADVYTVLTIGDGLVSQIPSLLVSLAAGIIVTKGGTEGAANEAVLKQLGGYPKATFMAAALLFGIGLLPGFPLIVFAPLALGIATVGEAMRRDALEAERAEAARLRAEAGAAAAPSDDPADDLALDDLRLSMGSGLATLVGRPGAALPPKVRGLRGVFARDYGFVLPKVRITDDPDLPPDAYTVSIRGTEVARGEVRAGGQMVIAPVGSEGVPPGEAGRDPTFGLEVVWTDSAGAEAAERAGLTVVDPESVIVTHLTEIVKDNMVDLLGHAATKALIEGLGRDHKALAAEIGGGQPIVLLQQVLQSLLAERVSIRDLATIVEAVAERARSTSDVAALVAHVRARLSRQICHGLADAQGRVPVIALGAGWERELGDASRDASEGGALPLAPSRVQDFVLAARGEIQRFADGDEWPALLVPAELRPAIRAMLERVSPTTPVLAHTELHRKVAVHTVARIGD